MLLYAGCKLKQLGKMFKIVNLLANVADALELKLSNNFHLSSIYFDICRRPNTFGEVLATITHFAMLIDSFTVPDRVGGKFFYRTENNSA